MNASSEKYEGHLKVSLVLHHIITFIIAMHYGVRNNFLTARSDFDTFFQTFILEKMFTRSSLVIAENCIVENSKHVFFGTGNLSTNWTDFWSNHYRIGKLSPGKKTKSNLQTRTNKQARKQIQSEHKVWVRNTVDPADPPISLRLL